MLSLSGGKPQNSKGKQVGEVNTVEDFIISLGLEPKPLGNPDLKPDFIFRASEKVDFEDFGRKFK